MRRTLMGLLLGLLGAATLLGTALAAHPSEDFPVRRVEDSYDRPGINLYRPEHNLGDLTFVDHYPDPDRLTDAERYMLRGCLGAPPGYGGHSMFAWEEEIMSAARFYVQRFGYFPEVMDPEAYAAAWGKDVSEVDQLTREILRSPITGRYPRLDAKEFSPGDFYVRLLDPEEMAHFAACDEMAYELWFNNRVKRSNGQWRYMDFNGKVTYVRMYGREEVIFNTIQYGFTWDKSEDTDPFEQPVQPQQATSRGDGTAAEDTE